MDALTRLAALVDQLLADHGRWREQAGQLELRLQERAGEQARECRRLQERLDQALRRVQDLEQERHRLRERLAALPDESSLAEARSRLERLLENLED
ncbi:MAG: hypothetical protein Q8O14_11010 [bacterium]|jgi:predicted  nucleic acid-binding Zn-ribbon protein|nr:hypothetical protein [bacterium]